MGLPEPSKAAIAAFTISAFCVVLAHLAFWGGACYLLYLLIVHFGGFAA